MTAAIVLGLMSAGLLGASDLVAKISGAVLGPRRTILFGHAAAAVVLTLVVTTRGLPEAGAADWGWSVLASLSLLLATGLMYRALSIGALSIVVPIASAYGGIAVILGALSGDALTPPKCAGVLLILAGGIVLARAGARSDRTGSKGIALAIMAALLYGVGLWVLGYKVVPVLGLITPVWIYYALGAALTLALSIANGAPIKASLRSLPGAVATSGLGAAGTLALTTAQATGEVTIATILSGLASGVAVLLGVIVLRETMARSGYAGLLLILAGLAIVHSGF